MPESELPLVLPETDNFRPSGSPESPLASVSDWVSFTDPQTGNRHLPYCMPLTLLPHLRSTHLILPSHNFSLGRPLVRWSASVFW